MLFHLKKVSKFVKLNCFIMNSNIQVFDVGFASKEQILSYYFFESKSMLQRSCCGDGCHRWMD